MAWRITSILIVLTAAATSYLLSTPSPISPLIIELSPLPTLSHNNLLKDAKHIQGLNAPESFARDSEGHLYTGVIGGWIMRTKKPLPNDLESNVEFEQFLKTSVGDQQSRPVGIYFDEEENRILVADAFRGLLAVDLEKREIKVLCGEADGEKLGMPNDVTIDPRSRIIYFSDSTAYGPTGSFYEALEGGYSGKLVAYHPGNQTCTTVVRNLRFPNGVTMTHSGDGVLVASHTTASILKYDPKTQVAKNLTLDLPGFPDNIERRLNGKTYFVSMSSDRAQPFSMTQFLGGFPFIRSLLARLPNDLILNAIPKLGLVVEIDEEGKVISTLQDREGKTPYISDVHEWTVTLPNEKGQASSTSFLFLGSWRNTFLGLVTLPDGY